MGTARMDGLGEQFLAGSGFTNDKNAGLRPGKSLGLLLDSSHQGSFSDNIVKCQAGRVFFRVEFPPDRVFSLLDIRDVLNAKHRALYLSVQ